MIHESTICIELRNSDKIIETNDSTLHELVFNHLVTSFGLEGTNVPFVLETLNKVINNG